MRCQPRYEGQVYICLNNVQTCLLCDEPAEAEMPICVACETDLPWLGDHCITCALPLAAMGVLTFTTPDISDSGKLVGLKAPYASLLAKQEDQLTAAATPS